MATQKNWIIKYVAGNPAKFTRVTTDAAGAIKRSDALAGAATVAANGWRVWVEHAVSGERIFESDIEKAFKEYGKLPEVTDDVKQWDGTVDHLVYWAQHEIDLVEEGEREDFPMPKTNERKIRAFIKKWSAHV